VAGFPALTDNHVRGPIVSALLARGWDVKRSVDVFGERNDDEELLVWAAKEGRALVTCDKGLHRVAHRWLSDARAFRMVYWWAEHQRVMSDGDIIRALEAIAARPDAFAYPIEYIKPKP
jgi:RimJ/RimL family protein N-acetyltransferase